ncbi:Oidioi.mRNA.OKI2018_I69.chr1.g320.t1.cds [Oikopleura dioica]|uniref:Oidioi.mRNA.OKI2018_I69.chr1.g320.t1.cds n=1 Tax=Oikopleura dioica TaxID=34765 RepID=A0ABN7SNQ3_OIKDI|nr:Oidioi.mRNA.OKI2018_I69.chr1.g320.t1.cds [Oikopleura dioica]
MRTFWLLILEIFAKKECPSIQGNLSQDGFSPTKNYYFRPIDTPYDTFYKIPSDGLPCELHCSNTAGCHAFNTLETGTCELVLGIWQEYPKSSISSGFFHDFCVPYQTSSYRKITEFTVVFTANITDKILLERIRNQVTEIEFDSWKMESDHMMASAKRVEISTRTRANRKHILYANFRILSYLKLKYGNAKNTLGRLDREISQYLSSKLSYIEGAKPIRNFPNPKLIVRIHEINGGVKTGVCFKGKNCKCTDVGEENEFPVQNTMLRTSRTGPQNKCSLKSRHKKSTKNRKSTEKSTMVCELHNFWEWVYNAADHFHRDPVANVVIYSSIGLFFATVAWVLTIPAYIFLQDVNPLFECGVHESSCHFIISLVFAAVVSVIFAIGIAAGEKHKPTLYSFFNGMGFLGMILELYSCIALTQTIVSYNKNTSVPNITTMNTTGNKQLINGLTYTAVACHFVVFFALFMALKFSFLVNWYFTYQDKLIYADTVRLKHGGMGGMHGNIDLGVAEIKDNNFKAEGLVKGMGKIKKSTVQPTNVPV